MYFFLGLITGLLLATLLIVLVMYFHQPIERKIRQVESKLKAKGSIIEASENEIEQWVEELKK